MNRTIKRYFTFAAGLLVLASTLSCSSEIAENDRLEPTHFEAKRSILIEDFTGQKCVNCPLATNTLHSLAEYFGDSIVSVAIHGGGFGVAEPKGLATAEAEAYYTAYNVTEQPNGVINHRGTTTSYLDWTKEVCRLIKTPTNVSMHVEASVKNGETLDVAVKYSGSEKTDAKLKVWLTEDNIVAPQIQPESLGGTNKNYVHSHVYRKAINDIEGTAVTVDNQTAEKTFSTSLESTYSQPYNVDNLYVVAFIYTDAEGVLQVTKKKVNNK